MPTDAREIHLASSFLGLHRGDTTGTMLVRL